MPTGLGGLYLAVATACLGCLVAGWVVRVVLMYRLRRRPASPGAGRPLDVWEIALLVAGPGRFAQVALVAMHRRRRAVIGADRRIGLLAPVPEDGYERAVFDAVGSARTAVTDPVVEHIARSTPTAVWRPARTRLEQDGLLLTEREVGPRGVTGLCGVLLPGLGFAIAGGVNGYPVPGGLLFFAQLAVVTPLFDRTLAPQTLTGRARIAELRTMPPTVSTDSDEDALIRLAVFGPEALPDPALRTALMPPPAQPTPG
ncbi:TIGR04222 domain-containing membrane protein [Embleya hyalina]|nr:TIGR04222 domain-containing membrane protein [Embleya hyalina]